MEDLTNKREWFLVTKDNKKVGVFKDMPEVQDFINKNKNIGNFEIVSDFFPINEEVTLNSFHAVKK